MEQPKQYLTVSRGEGQEEEEGVKRQRLWGVCGRGRGCKKLEGCRWQGSAERLQREEVGRAEDKETT